MTSSHFRHKFPCFYFCSRRYVAFQMSEVSIPRNLFGDILRLIAELRPPPAVVST
jgi:hypothetical protein